MQNMNFGGTSCRLVLLEMGWSKLEDGEEPLPLQDPRPGRAGWRDVLLGGAPDVASMVVAICFVLPHRMYITMPSTFLPGVAVSKGCSEAVIGFIFAAMSIPMTIARAAAAGVGTCGGGPSAQLRARLVRRLAAHDERPPARQPRRHLPL